MSTATAFGSSNTTVGSWSPTGNIYASDGSYVVTPGSKDNNYDMIVTGFGFSLPSDAIINSVSLEMGYYVSSSYSAATISMFIRDSSDTTRGDVWSSTAEPLSVTYPNYNTNGTWTYSELNAGCKAVIRVRRTSTTSCNYYFDYIKVIVDYTPPAAPISVNIGGTWKSGTAYINIGGTWKTIVSIKTNIGGTWK